MGEDRSSKKDISLRLFLIGTRSLKRVSNRNFCILSLRSFGLKSAVLDSVLNFLFVPGQHTFWSPYKRVKVER